MAITTTPKPLTIDTLNDNDREWFEERAGILEFEAHYPRDLAEQKALEMLIDYKKTSGTAGPGM